MDKYMHPEAEAMLKSLLRSPGTMPAEDVLRAAMRWAYADAAALCRDAGEGAVRGVLSKFKVGDPAYAAFLAFARMPTVCGSAIDMRAGVSLLQKLPHPLEGIYKRD